jgi:hypothetical protein
VYTGRHGGPLTLARGSRRCRSLSPTLQNDVDAVRKQIFDASKAVHRGAQSVAVGVTSKQLNEQTD